MHDGTQPRAVIVTGGGRGIGRAVALALGAAGHSVCVNDPGVDVAGRGLDREPAESVATEIRSAGGTAMASTEDARTSAAARQLLAVVETWSGAAPTVLVHAAGTLRDGMLHKISDDDCSEVLATHLAVAFELTRAMAGGLRAGGFGRIVYLGGAAGLVGNVGQAPYAVAKAALFGLTRAVALEMAGRDICVNYVMPFAYTRMTEAIPPVTDQLRDYRMSARQATPADIAPFLAWLCSEEASGISGQVFGARGAEIAIWSQPRPVAQLVDKAGWDWNALTSTARPRLLDHLVPVESEFDLFCGPPVAVGAETRL